MKSSTVFIISGAIALLGGILALVFPLPASLAVTVLVGWAFLISGALGLWAAFSDRGLQNRGWVGLISLLNLIVGVWMIANPLAGMVSLTIVVGIALIVSGAVRLYLAFTTYANSRIKWTVMLSGAVSLLLGLYILAVLPAASLVTLGVLVAIELLIVGATLLSLGLAARNRV